MALVGFPSLGPGADAFERCVRNVRTRSRKTEKRPPQADEPRRIEVCSVHIFRCDLTDRVLGAWQNSAGRSRYERP